MDGEWYTHQGGTYDVLAGAEDVPSRCGYCHPIGIAGKHSETSRGVLGRKSRNISVRALGNGSFLSTPLWPARWPSWSRNSSLSPRRDDQISKTSAWTIPPGVGRSFSAATSVVELCASSDPGPLVPGSQTKNFILGYGNRALTTSFKK